MLSTIRVIINMNITPHYDEIIIADD